MVKDAGDDPDVTHGALICAKVKRGDVDGISLKGGVGVGQVTLPGIGLPVGSPAINIVPQQQIRENVTDAILAAQLDEASPLEVTISVPDGIEIAKRTLNARLGGLTVRGLRFSAY